MSVGHSGRPPGSLRGQRSTQQRSLALYRVNLRPGLDKCGHVYLYGALGSGRKCPKCGERLYAPVPDVASAGLTWLRPPVPMDPNAPPPPDERPAPRR